MRARQTNHPLQQYNVKFICKLLNAYVRPYTAPEIESRMATKTYLFLNNAKKSNSVFSSVKLGSDSFSLIM